MNPVEQESERRLQSLLKGATRFGSYDARGDYSFPNGTWVELKAETKFTGNLFMEQWSNRAAGRYGWLRTLCTHELWYHFLDTDDLYIYDWSKVSLVTDIGTWRLVMQRKTEQQNDTWGWLVPVSEVVDCEIVRYLNGTYAKTHPRH